MTEEVRTVVTDLLASRKFLLAGGTVEAIRMEAVGESCDDVALDGRFTRSATDRKQLPVVVGAIKASISREVLAGRELARTCFTLETFDVEVLVGVWQLNGLTFALLVACFTGYFTHFVRQPPPPSAGCNRRQYPTANNTTKDGAVQAQIDNCINNRMTVSVNETRR